MIPFSCKGWLLTGLLIAQIATQVANADTGSKRGGATGLPKNTSETTMLTGTLSQAFTYQGHLTAGERPVNGTRQLEFTPVSAPRSGKVIAGPLEKSVVVTEGLFATTLGFDGNPFDGRALWLSMRMREPSAS